MEKISVTQIEERAPGEAYWKDVLEEIKQETDNYNVDTMCERCIKNQIENSPDGKPTIKCTGLNDYRNRKPKDEVEIIEKFMTPEQIKLYNGYYSAVDWLYNELDNPNLFNPRPYQIMIDKCSAKRKVLRMGRRCIAEYEKVLLSNGKKKKIKHVRPGDEVVSVHNGTLVHNKVLELVPGGVRDDLYQITLKSGKRLHLTYDHLVLTDRGWKSIQDGISKDMYVAQTCNGHIKYSEIKSIKKLKRRCKTFDLTIENTHNYIVNNIVVHNCGKTMIMTVGMLHRLVNFKAPIDEENGAADKEGRGYTVVMVAPQATMVEEVVEQIKKFCEAMPNNPIKSSTKSPIHTIKFENNNIFQGITAGSNGGKATRGKKCVTGDTKICVVDNDNIYFESIETILNKNITEGTNLYTVYKTINLTNNKEYIGLHSIINDEIVTHDSESGSCFKSGYLGSGKLLKQAVSKHKPENFKQTILYVFDTLKEAEDKERELVNNDYINNENTYNVSLGGNVCVLYGEDNGFYGKKHSKDTISRIQNSRNKTKLEKGIHTFTIKHVESSKVFHTLENLFDFLGISEKCLRNKKYIVYKMFLDGLLECEFKSFTNTAKQFVEKYELHEETKDKRMLQYRSQISERFKNKPKSEEQRKKISEANKGTKRENKHNKDSEKIRKTAEKHRGMLRSVESRVRMTLKQKSSKRFVITEDGSMVSKKTADILPTDKLVPFRLWVDENNRIKCVHVDDDAPKGYKLYSEEVY